MKKWGLLGMVVLFTIFGHTHFVQASYLAVEINESAREDEWVGTDVQNRSNYKSTNYDWPNSFASTKFTVDTKSLSPVERRYTGGTKDNITNFLTNAGKYLLIATMTLAVLGVTIGGIMIATTGPSDRAAKGKTIIQLNIMAVILALLSYSIIQFVRWLLSV